jgi:carbamoyl-phosphate synthase large subunit
MSSRRSQAAGLDLSLTSEILVEESVLGWKEFELEVMRDKADNVVIICSIENIDPMGIHTGDSITVAPAQTLTDKRVPADARRLARDHPRDRRRDGGSNIQFAINPEDRTLVVIEMNPRVSRSSALASPRPPGSRSPRSRPSSPSATRWTRCRNDITRETPACFEPSIDYTWSRSAVGVREVPRPPRRLLTTQMKSVGEAMAIGRTFKEAFQKACGRWRSATVWARTKLPVTRKDRSSRAQHRGGAARSS